VSANEVVLDRGATPARDPLLLLRAAAEAAERDLILAPATAARLARDCPTIDSPWPAEARNLLTRLLASGPGLLAVWETLDETGALERLLPEWERVRLLPHASEVHRYTVDRHLVETCMEASRLIRRVARPDVLMVAALLHDIGKGSRREHCVAGEPIARSIAVRLGFGKHEVDLIAGLVRWHLLLPDVATTRDLEDPATIDLVAGHVGDPEFLELLEALTESDARATSPKAWTPWRAGLVSQLATRVRARLSPLPSVPEEPVPVEIPGRLDARPGLVDVRVLAQADGSRVTVVAVDRLGLLAATAGAFAVLRVSVREARAWSQDEYAVSVWEVDDPHLDPAVLRQKLESILDGRFDATARLARRTKGLDPSVAVRPEASAEATVLEVRVDNHPGVVHLVCAALADLELSVRSAHVATVGPQAVDVFYVQEIGARALTDERSAAAAHAVRRALSDTVTLDASPTRD